MRILTFIMAYMMFCTFFLTLIAASMSYKPDAAWACIVSGVMFLILLNINNKQYWREKELQRRRIRDRRKYGNRDFTQEDQLIYKALKQKS